MPQSSEPTGQVSLTVEDVYPLTPSQAGMLFHTLYAPGLQLYVNQYVFALRGSPDAAALRRAWQGAVERHPVLRTSFAWEGLDTPLQVVYRGAALPWEAHDWRALPREEQAERRTRYLEADRERGFDLTAPPLLRVALLRTADDAWELVWSYHHLLFDGWSMGLILRDVFGFYEAELRGSGPSLPRSRLFRDYVAWLQRQELSEAEAFWRRTLEGFTAPTPLGIDRPAAPLPDGEPELAASSGQVERRLSATATSALLGFARAHRLTHSTLWQGAWGVLLSRYSGEEDVVFGATVSGREAGPRGMDAMVGLFINTLPVRLELRGEARVGQSLERLQAQQAEARRYDFSPFAQVQKWSEIPAGTPLLESVVVFENHPVWNEVGGGENGFRVEGWEHRSQGHYALTLTVLPGERTVLRLEYDRQRIEAAAAERMAGHLETVLEGLAADPARRLSEVPLLRNEERARVLESGRAPAAALPGACIPELFTEQAARTPDAPAVVSAEGMLSFAGLERASGRIARRLRARGVGPETVVAVLMEHSPEVVAVLLGVLRAGGVYLPLDPGAPAGRLGHVLRDARAALVLAQPGLEARLPSGEAAVLPIEPSWTNPGGEDAAPLPSLSPENAAYLIYTSGSTGTPKGVVVPHGAAASHLRHVARAYGHTPADRVLAFAALTFDQSIEDILAPLVAGASVAVREPAVWTPAELAERVHALGITQMNLSTAYWVQLVGDRPASRAVKEQVRVIVAGGEALTSAAVRAWDEVPGGSVRLVNGYGPTETVVTATVFDVSPGRSDGWGAGVPIGRPVGGRAAYVLDATGEPAPVGVPGELCIGGVEVARGYLGLPELTAVRFVPDAFGEEPGGRLYRTGDRVRWLESGDLEFLARVDSQVKVRGFRIEPGEIEAALLGDARVREAAVVAREDAPGERRLVAYVAAAGAGESLGAELRAGLRERLPEYMVPRAFVVLERLPLNASGKVDRRALPAPERGVSGGERTAPRTAAEEALAGIWAAVLGVEEVGVEESFFELGGHSLLAMQVASRVRQALGVELPLRALFEAPTVAALAERVEALRSSGAAAALPPVERVPRDAPLPLSFAQQRLWFIDQLAPGSSTYNVPLALRLRGGLRLALLERALTEIVRRHEALRTVFASVGGEPVQVVRAPAPAGVPVVDLRGLPEAAREAELRRLAAEESARPFDLAEGPLLRTAAVWLGESEWAVLFTLHHIVSDGWSMGVLVNEVSELYGALHEGREPGLPELPVQYADYAAWQRAWLAGETLEAQLAWWRERLAGTPPLLELPTDHPRPQVQDARGGVVPIALPAELSQALEALSRREGVTLFMTLLAGVQVLLARWSGQEDVAVGSPIANRTQTETEGLIGFFANTLVMRTDLGGNPTARELLGRVRAAALGAYQHQDLPFERLVEELAPERSLAHSPLFQVLFVLQNAAMGELRLGPVEVEPLEAGPEGAKFDLNVSLWSRERITGSVQYRASLWERPTMERLVRHLEAVLRGMAAEPEGRISELELLDAVEREQVLRGWNATEAEYPVEGGLAALFEAQAERTPDAPALVFLDRSLSYAELEREANRLARRLQAVGVGPDVRVGLCAERSPEMVVGVLAVLKAGAAYVPLDPAYPAERLAYMLEDSGCRVLLTQERLLDRLPAHGAQTVCLDRPLEGEAEAGPPRVAVSPENLAYVIYTSGSTGRPKGVAMTQRPLQNLIAWQFREWSHRPAARTLQFSSISFDASFQEMFSTWGSGGTLVLVSEETRTDLAALARLVERERIERIFLPFVALQHLAEAALAQGIVPEALRELMTAGEQLRVTEQIRRWLEAAPECELVNLYGPSETHVVSALRLSGETAGWPALPSIGRPVSNTQLYVLDASLGPAPLGVPGELFLGGDSVARGYLGRPDVTAERFVPDPFSGDPGARMYRSGDRARWLAGGELEFLGRVDQQVKVRGFRIEPGEVEAALEAHPGVRRALVDAREDAPGHRRLVGYVVPEEGAEVTPAELRAYLATRLPEYMVPGAFVVLEAFPLTPSGKIDRRALPTPDASDGEAYAPPRTPAEEVLAGIYAGVLGRERVGARDGFFALGGHSLLATRAMSRIREAFGVEVPLRVLFEAPTVAALAEHVEGLRGSGAATPPPIERVSRGEPLPLSFAQQRLWIVDRLEPGSAAYNMPFALRLRGALDVAALRGSLDALVERHETLRTTFEEREGGPVQVIHPPVPAALAELDLRGLPEPEREAERLAGEEALRPFDLARGPLVRSTLLRLADHDHVLCFTLHHVVSDGWSMDVLVREVSELYGAFSRGEAPRLPELPVQYADYAVWQRAWLSGEVLEEQIGFWKGRLAGVPPLLEIPTDRPRSTASGARGASQDFALPAELTRGLRDLARREGATLFMTLLAGWQALLGRYAGQEDVVVGSPIAGRTRRETEGLIGFFVNMLALRADLSGDPTWTGLLGRVRETALGAYDHQDLPFERLVDELAVERSLTHASLFQATFALQKPGGDDRLSLGEVGLEPFGVGVGVAKFDLELALVDDGEALAGALAYRAGLFEAETVARMAGHLEVLLESMAADPRRRLSEVPLLRGEERAQVLEGWNAAVVLPPACIHETFAAQAARTPHAPALLCGDQVLTYAELDARANRLAHLLRRRGVAPDVRVALCLERGPEMVVALLGVLKAGGAYACLDPELPPARLALLVADLAAPLVLSRAPLRERLPEDVDVLCLDTQRDLLSREPSVPPAVEVTPEHLCYVIYTSGSTGTPKGTEVPHRAVAGFFRDAEYARFDAGRGAAAALLGLVGRADAGAVAGAADRGPVRAVPGAEPGPGGAGAGGGAARGDDAVADGGALQPGGGHPAGDAGGGAAGDDRGRGGLGCAPEAGAGAAPASAAGERLRAERVHGVRELPRGGGGGRGRGGADRAAGGGPAGVRAGRVGGAGAGGGAGRAARGWRGGGAGVPGASGADGGEVRPRRVRGRGGRAAVPERGPGEVAGERGAGVPGADGRAGQDPGVPDRAGGGRGGAPGAGGGAGGGGGGAGGRAGEPAPGGLRGHGGGGRDHAGRAAGPPGGAAPGVHGAGGARDAGSAAAERERQGGPGGAAGAGSGVRGGVRGAAHRQRGGAGGDLGGGAGGGAGGEGGGLLRAGRPLAAGDAGGLAGAAGARGGGAAAGAVRGAHRGRAGGARRGAAGLGRRHRTAHGAGLPRGAAAAVVRAAAPVAGGPDRPGQRRVQHPLRAAAARRAGRRGAAGKPGRAGASGTRRCAPRSRSGRAGRCR